MYAYVLFPQNQTECDVVLCECDVLCVLFVKCSTCVSAAAFIQYLTSICISTPWPI